jgi:hypothetical protein
MGRRPQPDEVENPQPQPQPQTNEQPQQQQQQVQPEDIEKSIADVENQIKANAGNEARIKQLQEELERLKAAQALKK